MRTRYLASIALSCLVTVIGCSDGTQTLAARQAGSEGGGSGGFSGGPPAGTSGSLSGGTAGGLKPTDPNDDLAGCASARFEKSLRPLLLYILLDQSGSMKEKEDRYTPVAKAIQNFAESASSTGIVAALQFFALGSSQEQKCSASTYALPEVEPRLLPENASAFVASLTAHDFPRDECCTNDNEHQGTPTRPAVEGALQYLKGRNLTHPEEVQALLLATDGLPTGDCDDNTLDDVSSLLETARSAAAPVRTYVIGIGKDDSLNALAKAGGTGEKAFLVDDTGAATETEFLAALNDVRGQAVPCDYELPAQALENRARVNVTYQRDGEGKPITAVAVGSAADCDSAVDQWFYEEGPTETRIRLCPRLCRTVSEASSGAVEIVVGCDTRVK